MKWTLKNVALLLAPLAVGSAIGVAAWISPALAIVAAMAVILLGVGGLLVCVDEGE